MFLVKVAKRMIVRMKEYVNGKLEDAGGKVNKICTIIEFIYLLPINIKLTNAILISIKRNHLKQDGFCQTQV